MPAHVLLHGTYTTEIIGKVLVITQLVVVPKGILSGTGEEMDS